MTDNAATEESGISQEATENPEAAGESVESTAVTATADEQGTDNTQEAQDSQDEAATADGDSPPEEYEFTLPDGVGEDEALMSSFKEVARELGLTQEQAQQLVDMQTKHVSEAAEQQAEQWKSVMDEWVNTAKEDKEFGGQNFDANLGIARKAVEAFGTPEFREALEITGMGNHPELIRFMVRVGKAIGEDKLHHGHIKAGEPRTQADILFPNHGKE